MPNIAIFGGTFNPVHWGHLLIAETAFDQFKLDQVLWVPTFRPPHKNQALVAYPHRREMVRRAIADHPGFTLSANDGQPQGTSYAIATLKALQVHYPGARWYWILGNDAFQSLPRWQASQELATHCTWLVAPRSLKVRTLKDTEATMPKGSGLEHDASRQNTANVSAADPNALSVLPSPASPSALHTLQLQYHWLQMPSIEVSSSLLRQWCQKGRSLRYWVPETVRCYIIEQNLYETSQNTQTMS